MKWITAAALTCMVLVSAPTQALIGETALQRKVDRSFSAILIDTPFSRVRRALVKDSRSCDADGECEWRDVSGVRHTFWGELRDETLVLKIVDASEFRRKPIKALGIGQARSKAQVIAQIRKFDHRIVLDCDPKRASGNVGYQECSAMLGPGWIEVGFDRNGWLTKVRFDGYQYT